MLLISGSVFSPNCPMMSLIRNEIRIPLSAVFFLCIGVPIYYRDILGTFTTICFSLGSLCLFCVFAIMPIFLQHRYTEIENRFHRHQMYHRLIQENKGKALVEHEGDVKVWIVAGVSLLVIGVIGLLVVH